MNTTPIRSTSSTKRRRFGIITAAGVLSIVGAAGCGDDDSPDDVDIDPVTSQVTDTSMVSVDSEVTIGTTLTSEVEITNVETEVSEVELTEPGITSDG